MTPEIMEWLAKIRKERIPNPGKVLEAGSYDINGSPRKHFQEGSTSYLGVDACAGPGVDMTAEFHELGRLLKPEFDTILCCEALEHDKDPIKSVEILRSLLVPGGHLILTSPANGFPMHRYPRDYWRIMPDAYQDVLLNGMLIKDIHLTSSSCWCYLAEKLYGTVQTLENAEKPIVVWHCAALGSWKEVAKEQLALLKAQDLTEVHATFVGQGLDWLLKEAQDQGVTLKIDRSDENVLHYETFAMLLIERMAKETERPFLYFHTKGVSAPSHQGKQKWRRLMEKHVVEKWRENMAFLKDYDLVGVDWFYYHKHFCGNFWMARADWLRKLADFLQWHQGSNRVRTSCEFWIGSAPNPRVKSLVCSDENIWYDDYSFEKFGL
jgi:hypothetical protein